jgi:hypothetical protein
MPAVAPWGKPVAFLVADLPRGRLPLEGGVERRALGDQRRVFTAAGDPVFIPIAPHPHLPHPVRRRPALVPESERR